MKTLLFFVLCLRLSAQVIHFSCGRPDALPPAASDMVIQKAANSTKPTALSFEGTADTHYFFICVPEATPIKGVKLGQFAMPMAGAEEGYPKKIVVDGKPCLLYRTFNQIGGASTSLTITW